MITSFNLVIYRWFNVDEDDDGGDGNRGMMLVMMVVVVSLMTSNEFGDYGSISEYDD